MCNACGFRCCALDTFEKCGCEGCDEPECWADDWDDRDDVDDWAPPVDCCARPRAGALRCEAA